MMCHLGVAEVNGKGVCCFLDRDTSYDGLGFVNCVLRCRDAQSGFFMKFHGFRHSAKIRIGNDMYGQYSYQYRGDRTAAEVAEILQKSAHALYDIDGGITEDNRKVSIKLYEGVKPMGFL